MWDWSLVCHSPGFEEELDAKVQGEELTEGGREGARGER